jgi:nitrogen fixation protein FixH
MLLALSLSGALVLVACSGSDNPQSSAVTEGLLVTLQTQPAQPRLGQTELIVEVKDADGRAVDGATVTLKADMIGHSMGDLSGQATGQTNGRYTTRANLSMAGEWQVDVQVKTVDKDVQRRFKIEVQ